VDLPAVIRDLSGGGAQVSLDALGSRETCRNSILCLAKRGRHVQVGLMEAEDRDPPVPMQVVIARELEIFGSHGMPAHSYGSMFELIRTGKLGPEHLVRKTVSLEEAARELIAMGEFVGVGVTVIDRF
jgi:alcohol dehydrogenase